MKNSKRLVMTSLRVIPSHMERLRVVTAANGLNSAAVIRMLISEYIRREEAKQVASAK
jgi:hypothetical protein